MSLRLSFCGAALLLLAWVTSAVAEVKVGALLPLGGDFAKYGELWRRGIESVEMPNVRIIYEDEGCQPAMAMRAYRKLLAADGVRIFIGPGCGSPQVVVASALAQDGAISLLGSSAPIRVFELSMGRMLSVQHSIEDESTFNAREMYKQGMRRVVILSMEHDFGRAHEAAFRSAFKGEVLSTLTYSVPDASALRPLVTTVRTLNPDALYIPDAGPLLHGLARRLSEAGLNKLPIYSVYSVQSQEVLDAIRDTGIEVSYSYPQIDGDALAFFPALAAKLLAAALKECPTGEAECVLRSLKEKNDFDNHGVLRGEIQRKQILGDWLEGAAD